MRTVYQKLSLILGFVLWLAACGSGADGGGTIPIDQFLDLDGDGLNGFEESKCHSDPILPDTDDDGLNDKEECLVRLTSPLNQDSDCDGTKDHLDAHPPSKAAPPLFINTAEQSEVSKWKVMTTGYPGNLLSSVTASEVGFDKAKWCPNTIDGIWDKTCRAGKAYFKGVYSLPDRGAKTWARITNLDVYIHTDNWTLYLDMNGARLAGNGSSFINNAWFSPLILGHYPIDGKIAFGVYGTNEANSPGVMLFQASVAYDSYYSVDSCP